MTGGPTSSSSPPPCTADVVFATAHCGWCTQPDASRARTLGNASGDGRTVEGLTAARAPCPPLFPATSTSRCCRHARQGGAAGEQMGRTEDGGSGRPADDPVLDPTSARPPTVAAGSAIVAGINGALVDGRMPRRTVLVRWSAARWVAKRAGFSLWRTKRRRRCNRASSASCFSRRQTGHSTWEATPWVLG